MLERGTEELTAGAYIIRWTSILSNRFDSTSFKKVYGDLYKAFTKQTASRRFSISC
jgi:predicted phage-related endonuclease